MAFLRRKRSDPSGKTKRDWVGALEDGVIVFLIVLVEELLRFGYPPTEESLFFSFLTALLIFLYSIQRKFGIELPEEVKPLDE